MLPKTTPEQRGRFYTDVDGLLSPGFLTHSVVVCGVRLHIRSLGAGDLFLLKARTEGSSGYEWRVWSVATAIWMIDGVVVLGHDEIIPFLAARLRSLPKTSVEILFSILLGLWMRVGDAVSAAEVYCLETGSRYKWKTMGLAGLLHTGVTGANNLGLNAVQRIWVAFNEMEDARHDDEMAWEGFKLVASSNAPKAIQKLDRKDQQRRDASADQCQRDLDTHYYQQLGVVDDAGRVEDAKGSHQGIQGAKTVEDLEDEMRRWVVGDPDIHDQAILDYKDRIRRGRAKEQAERDARRRALEEKRTQLEKDAGEYQPTPLVAMTAEQLQHMLSQRGPGRRGTTFIPASPDADRLYGKYIGDGGIDAGKLQIQDGKVVDAVTDERTLNQIIEGRSPAFGAGE